VLVPERSGTVSSGTWARGHRANGHGPSVDGSNCGCQELLARSALRRRPARLLPSWPVRRTPSWAPRPVSGCRKFSSAVHAVPGVVRHLKDAFRVSHADLLLFGCPTTFPPRAPRQAVASPYPEHPGPNKTDAAGQLSSAAPRSPQPDQVWRPHCTGPNIQVHETEPNGECEFHGRFAIRDNQLTQERRGAGPCGSRSSDLGTCRPLLRMPQVCLVEPADVPHADADGVEDVAAPAAVELLPRRGARPATRRPRRAPGRVWRASRRRGPRHP